MAKDLISICGCTYNRSENTKLWLPSLWNTLEHDKFDYEIFIADNGSKDDTVEYLKDFTKDKKITLTLYEKNVGKARALNKFFKICKGNYIVSTDNDIIVSEGWTTGLHSIIKEFNKVGVVAPMYKENCNYPIPKKYAHMMSQQRDYITPQESGATVAGGFFMMPRCILELTGGYKVQNCYGGIDGGFMHQVGQLKFNIGYTKRVIVEHCPEIDEGYAKWKAQVQRNLHKYGCFIHKVDKGYWDE